MLYKESTLQNAVAATGNGVQLEVTGYSKIALVLSGTFVGTVTFEVSLDGTVWEGFAMRDIDNATIAYVLSLATSGDGAWSDLLGGWRYFRARVSAYTSGAITVKVGLIP